MLVQKYNPTLRDLVKVDTLPPNLGFLQGALGNILDKLFYQNLQAFKSSSGNSASYSLDIITYRKLTLLEIPGTGIAFVVNPSALPNIPSASVFNVSFEYQWEILKYIRNANLQTFGFDIRSYLNLLGSIFSITEKDFLAETINVFLGEFDPPPVNGDPLQDFVDKYNANHTNQLSYIPGTTTYDDIYNDLVSFNQDIFQLIIEDYLNNFFERLKLLIAKFIGPLDEERLKDLLLPQFSASINNVSFGIEFPQTIFKPIDTNTQLPTTDPNFKTTLIVNAGAFSYDTKSGFLFSPNLSFTFPKSEILGTGFTLLATGLKIDLSETRNIPEADLDGRPRDFKGVYIKEATIGFPAFWNHDDPNSTGQVNARNLLCGTGGISGTLGLELKPSQTGDPSIKAKFGSGFEISLNAFSITFQQNSIIESNIQGKMKIPGFKDTQGSDAELDIIVHIENNGEFSVTISEEQGIDVLRIPNVLDITLSSVSLGREGGRFFIAVSGLLDFTANIAPLGDVLPKQLDIKKIVIWDDGQIELEGGAIVLPEAVTLKLGPANLSVTAIGMGSHEQLFNNNPRKYRFIEFSAGVSVNPGGVDVRGDGVKLFFTIDNDNFPDKDIFVRIAGIGIDLIIPGSASKETAAVLVSGFLSMKNPEPDPGDPSQPNNPDTTADVEYAGGVDFILPKAKIAGSAAMRFNPGLPAFLIDVGLEIAKPIPLGSTGLGIYGFRGLVGQRYVASKTYIGLAEDAEWYQYYKKKVSPENKEGITASKFAPKQGFALGAGISLATSADEGRAFSSKLFFLLSLPDVFLIQGQAAILRKRIGLDDTVDPPFFAIIAITNQSVEAAFGVNYKLPESGPNPGSIVKVDGLTEMAYYFGNSSAWFVNIGRDTPAEKRIQARIYSLFNAYFYLMLNSGGLRAGAGASWEISKKYGPVALELGAYLDTAGRISFHPKQLGGSIQLGGYARIKVFKFKLGFVVSASLAGEAPKPFIVTGSLSIGINLPKPFKDITVTVSLTWVFVSSLNDEAVELLDTVTGPDGQLRSAKAVNLLTKEAYPLYFPLPNTPLDMAFKNALDATGDDYTIPMDCMIDIELPKPVKPYFGKDLPVPLQPNTFFGGFTQSIINQELIGPQQGKSPMVDHRYEVKGVKIFSWDPAASAWVDYNLYAAATPLQTAPFINNSILSGLFSGYWQFDQPNKYTKLSILAQTPLNYLTSGAGGLVPEEFGIEAPGIFCPPDPIAKTCVNFDDLGYDTLAAGLVRFLKSQVLIRVIGEDGEIITVSNPYGHIHAMQLREGTKLEIFFIQPVTCVDLTLSTKADSVTIEYFKREQQVDVNQDPILDESGMTTWDYEMQGTPVTVFRQDIGTPISYNDVNNAINKVVITAGPCAVPPNIVCDPSVTPTALLLQTFLNMLTSRDDLVSPLLSFAGITDYQNTFCNTALYTGSASGCEILYTATFGPTILEANITDNIDFNAYFRLEVENPSTKFNFTSIVSFTGITHDPAHTGDGKHYDFKVTANVSQIGGGTLPFVLKGSSNRWPILICRVIDYLLEEGGGYLKQEDDFRLIIDLDESIACSTLVHEICWLNQQDHLVNTNSPSFANVMDDNQAMLNGINLSLLPVWRPETLFAVQVTTKDEIVSPPSVKNSPTGTVSNFTFGFRTRGTIGHYHIHKDEYAELFDIDRGDQFKLASLKHYIDYGKSYPNADGNILSAKPLFYKNPKLLLFYLRDYVYSMLNNWDPYPALAGNGVNIQMECVIKDPAESPFDAQNDPVIAPSVIAAFEDNDIPHISGDVTLISNMLSNGQPCTGVSSSVSPIGVNTAFQMPDYLLKPLKLYTAIFNVNAKPYPASPNFSAQQKAEVHRYNFQTSRYESFAQQIGSYILDNSNPPDIRRAVFETVINPFDIAKAQMIVDDNLPVSDALFTEFADRFDRILDGALRIGALQAALTTEFNIIRDENTMTLLGILVRNPEPFNDPKLPATELSQSLQFSMVGPPPNGAPVIIFSKDRAMAFVTNSLMDLGAGSPSFIFKYFEYDGTGYVVKDTQNVQFDLT